MERFPLDLFYGGTREDGPFRHGSRRFGAALRVSGIPSGWARVRLRENAGSGAEIVKEADLLGRAIPKRARRTSLLATYSKSEARSCLGGRQTPLHISEF